MSAVSACRIRGVGPLTVIAAIGRPVWSRIGVATQPRRARAPRCRCCSRGGGCGTKSSSSDSSVVSVLRRRGLAAAPCRAARRRRRVAPGQQRLAGAGGVGGDRAADLGEQPHAAGAGDAVDVDDVLALEDDEVRRLAGLALDRLQVRARGGAQPLQAVLQAAGELEQLVAEQVAPAGGRLRRVPTRD